MRSEHEQKEIEEALAMMRTDPSYELRVEPTDDPKKHRIVCTFRMHRVRWERLVQDLAKRTVVLTNVKKG